MSHDPGRRRAIKAMAAGTAALGLSPYMKTSRADKRPNMVFILTDDHRWDAFGFMGKEWLKTPNMDRIAQEGVHFRNSFVTTSLCSPSRASFLTGRYAHCHGVMNNTTPWKESNVTFLEMLRTEGYRTGFIGKWHMPGEGVPDLAGQGKVDRMVSFSYGTGQGRYTDCPLIVDGAGQKSRGYITDVLTDYALEFLEKSGKGPFCLFLSHKAAHAFFKPAPRHEGELSGVEFNGVEDDRGLPMGLDHYLYKRFLQKYQQRYYESLLAVDDSVGRVLGMLDDRGWAENTLLVYAGDNGFLWGEHGLVDKRYAYEQSIRVPHLVRFPRMAPRGGKRVDEMVLNIDLAPALLEAAGIKPPPGNQGSSWLGLLEGRALGWRHSFLYEYYEDLGFPHPPIRGVRTREWKLITYPGHEKKFPREMYDLAEDPGEKNNLAENPEFEGKKRELEAELARLMAETGC